MLGKISETGSEHPIQLVYGVTNDVDLVAVDRLEEFASKIPGFSFVTCVAAVDSAHPRKGYVSTSTEGCVWPGEETDVGPNGEPVSHLELYLGAMREVGANTGGFENFQAALTNGASLVGAFDRAQVAPFVREFTGYTLHTARRAPLLAVMASFFYGREDIIPRMFSNLLDRWRIGTDRAPLFVYYLNRHIEVDSDQHGPAAKAILDAAIADDPQREQEVLRAARQSIDARIKLWDGLLISLNRWRRAGMATA